MSKMAKIEIKNYLTYTCLLLAQVALDDIEDFDCEFQQIGGFVDLKTGKLWAVVEYQGTMCETSLWHIFGRPILRPIYNFEDMDKYHGVKEKEFFKVLDILENNEGA